jgi:hypothetical protein
MANLILIHLTPELLPKLRLFRWTMALTEPMPLTGSLPWRSFQRDVVAVFMGDIGTERTLEDGGKGIKWAQNWMPGFGKHKAGSCKEPQEGSCLCERGVKMSKRRPGSAYRFIFSAHLCQISREDKRKILWGRWQISPLVDINTWMPKKKR